jgi:hypothetical protein
MSGNKTDDAPALGRLPFQLKNKHSSLVLTHVVDKAGRAWWEILQRSVISRYFIHLGCQGVAAMLICEWSQKEMGT